jgi:hypothetical protein
LLNSCILRFYQKKYNIFTEDSSKPNSPVTTESQNMATKSHDMATKSHDKASTSHDKASTSQDMTTESQDITTEYQDLTSKDMTSKNPYMPLAKVYVHKRNKAKCKGVCVCLFVCLFICCLFWYPGTAFFS